MNLIIKLGGRYIKPNSSPYVIAEIGVNHEGSLSQAKRLIELAKEGGADAAKFQSYKADTLASKHSPSYWDISKEPTRSQHELFKKYDSFGAAEYIMLAEHCRSVGIDFLSTPFDDDSVEFLCPLVPFFKIASADLTNIPFLRKVASKGKPIVLSTGASTLTEIDIAMDTINKAGCSEIALLHCILNYPTSNSNAHLRMIEGLKRVYPNNIIGYSDHTHPDNSMTSLFTAFLLGAVIIEKHFTHDKTLPGNDHYHAMDVTDLRNFLKLSEKAIELMGVESHKAPILSEELSRKNARRSIVAVKAISEGEVIQESDLTYKRPGTGISPLFWNEVIGRTAVKNIDEDDLLQWHQLSS